MLRILGETTKCQGILRETAKCWEFLDKAKCWEVFGETTKCQGILGETAKC